MWRCCFFCVLLHTVISHVCIDWMACHACCLCAFWATSVFSEPCFDRPKLPLDADGTIFQISFSFLPTGRLPALCHQLGALLRALVPNASNLLGIFRGSVFRLFLLPVIRGQKSENGHVKWAKRAGQAANQPSTGGDHV
jgi:hypothetical protein